MERIGDDVRLVFRRFGGSAGGMDEIVRAWPEAVGDAVARNAWPARLARDGTLHVAASSSTWAFELTQLSGQIQSRLAERLGDRTPERLRFAPGKIPEPGLKPISERRAVPPSPGPSERADARRFAAAIEDEELRDLVARAAAASLATAGSGRGL
jgi:hypothetical protein